MAGRVVGGYHEGRKLGFPTANIELADRLQLVPETGVYAVNVSIDGGARLAGGMMNIGNRPTFDGTETTLEVNIFGFSGDLYGHEVSVKFVKRLRGERKFSSAAKLAEQLEADRADAMAALEASGRQL